MNKVLLFILLTGYSLATLCADANKPQKVSSLTKAKNTTAPKATLSKKELEKQIQAQIEREKKYAREQMFYQGDEYNLSEKQVDPKLLKNIPKIEPDYDFDITDVYRDDI